MNMFVLNMINSLHCYIMQLRSLVAAGAWSVRAHENAARSVARSEVSRYSRRVFFFQSEVSRHSCPRTPHSYSNICPAGCELTSSCSSYSNQTARDKQTNKQTKRTWRWSVHRRRQVSKRQHHTHTLKYGPPALKQPHTLSSAGEDILLRNVQTRR